MRTEFDFEDVPLGLQLSFQYEWHGVLFVRAETGDLPKIIEHQGRHLAALHSYGEFEQNRARIRFRRCHQRVELELVNGRDVETNVYVRGLDAGNNVVCSVTARLGGATGSRTVALLEASASTIQTVLVRATMASDVLWLDTLRIDAGAQGPSFALELLSGATYGQNLIAYGGQTINLRVKVHRLLGSSGPIDLRVVGLPPGATPKITAVAGMAEHLVQLVIASGFTHSGALRIEGVPRVLTAGSAAGPIELHLTVTDSFTITSPVMKQELPPCTLVQHPIRVSGARWFGGLGPWTGKVTLSVPPVRAGMTVRFVPSEVTLTAAKPEADVVMEIIDHSHGPYLLGWTLTVVGTSPPHAPVRYELAMQGVAPVVTGLSPKVGETPRARLPGTEITLTGTGFCGQADAPAATVVFGNDLATAPLLRGSADGRTGAVRVPRLATTGKVKVTSMLRTSQTTTDLEIRSWRNTHGYSFKNPDLEPGHYTWDDLTEAFGQDQTFLTISFDPCNAIPLFGLFIDCGGPRVAFAPNPLGLITLGLARSLSACCFGMSVTSARVLRNEDSVMKGHIPAGGRGLWDTGTLAEVLRRLRAMSGQQFSVEFIHAFLKTLVDVDDPGGASRYTADLKQTVLDTLRAGKYPLVEMRTSGWGHFVVATDILESPGPGVSYALHIYDPNGFFRPSEVTPDGVAHRQAEIDYSRVEVLDDGHWRYPKDNATDSKTGGTQGFDAGIMAVPPSLTPVRPTMIGSLPDMGTWVGGSAAVTQLSTGSGRRLMRQDGSFDLDAATGRAAAPWPGHSGNEGASGWLTQETGRLTIGLGGRGTGPGEVIVFGGGYMARVRPDSIGPGAPDELVADRNEGSLGYQTVDDTKRVELLVQTTAPDQSSRALLLRCMLGRKGALHMAYLAAEGVFRVRFAGRQSSAIDAIIGWSGAGALPDGADLRDITLQPDDVLTLRPTDWTALGSTPVLVEIDHASGDVAGVEARSLPPEPKPGLRLWSEHNEGGRLLGMTITLDNPALWVQMALVWAVRAGSEIVAHGSEMLREGIDTGTLEHRVRLAPNRPGPYAVAVHVRGILVGPPFRQSAVYEELAFA